MARQKIAAGKGTVCKVKSGRLVVARLQLAVGKITQQLRPGIFGVADDDGIGVRLGVVGNERYVRPAEHDRDAALPKMIGQFISAHRRAGDDGQPNEVGIKIKRHIGNAFIEQLQINGNFRRNQRRQRGQRQRLVAQRFFPDAAAMPVKRPFRGNQNNFKFSG